MIFPAFAVPMCALHLPNAEALNAQLKALLITRELPEHRNPRASMEQPHGLYESEFNLFAWPDAPIVALKMQVWQAIGQFIAELNGYDAQALSTIQIRSHTWFHITRRGGYFGLHNHPMASVSGVYCVHPGTSDPDRPNSGTLRFHCPHNYSNMYLDLGNANVIDQFANGNRSFQLQAGQLILFPSWLMHEVLPFFGDDERITIAFNCWFDRKSS
jgi:uncharacterized protein (TIGR02466 family)